MPLTIDHETVSNTPWGDVDKEALGKKLADLFSKGQATRSDIGEVYAFLPNGAFVSRGGKAVFQPSVAKFPHHQLMGNRIVLNRGGVAAALADANGAHGVTIPSNEKEIVLGHLKRHTKQLEGGAAIAKSFDSPLLVDVYDRMQSWQYPVPPETWTPLMLDLPAEIPSDIGDVELAKALPQIFKSPGGKKWVAKRLSKMLPPHKRYGEVFSGSAAVFWQKDPAPEEILNDLRTNLIDTYRFIRDARDFTPLYRKNWEPSRERFNMLRKWVPDTPVNKAYKYLWLSRASLMNKEGESYSPVMAQKNMHIPLKSRFQKWHDRLQGTTLLENDAMQVLQKYDDPLTAFYIDPPYPKGRDPDMYPGHEYTMADLDKLFEICEGLKAKWMMSLNPKSLPKAGLPKNMMVKKLAVWYPVLPTSHKSALHGREGQIRMEVIVHNYPIRKGV